MKERDATSLAFDRELGKKIRECRLSMGLSQGDVVAKLQLEGVDICRQIYAKIEDGLRPAYPMELVHLIEILNIDVLYFAANFTSSIRPIWGVGKRSVNRQ